MARILAGILAIAGAILVLVSNFVTLYSFSEFSYKVFDSEAEPRSLWFLGLEPTFVAVAAVGLGVALMVRRMTLLAGILIGLGSQTIALFLAYLGWLAFDRDSLNDPGVGIFIGLVGGFAILAAGLISWLAPRVPAEVADQVGASAPITHPVADEAPTAGWYPDPSGEARLRYWDGTSWASETRD